MQIFYNIYKIPFTKVTISKILYICVFVFAFFVKIIKHEHDEITVGACLIMIVIESEKVALSSRKRSFECLSDFVFVFVFFPVILLSHLSILINEQNKQTC
jgi:hypothetical protein